MSPRSKEQSEQIRAERRAQILDAARQVFSEKGFSEARVSDVAARAGVSQGTIYWYFDSKDDLFMATFEAWIEGALLPTFAEIAASQISASEKLYRCSHATAQMMAQSADFLPVQMEFWSYIPRNPAIQARFRQFFARYRASVASIIEEGIAGGEFRAVDANRLASIAIAAWDGLATQWMAEPEAVDWHKVSKVLADSLLEGIRKR